MASYITTEEYTVASDGVTVDLIIWNRFKAPMPGLIEYLLAMPENQGLEHCNAVLPLGTVVYVPIPAPASQTVAPVIDLWS